MKQGVSPDSHSGTKGTIRTLNVKALPQCRKLEKCETEYEKAVWSTQYPNKDVKIMGIL